MNAAQIVAAAAGAEGTLAEKFGLLVDLLAKVDVVGVYKAPRCACGAELLVNVGRQTGLTFIKHPHLAPKPCPRVDFKAWGKDGPAAMLVYVAKAPDLGDLDAPPPEDDPAPEIEFEA